jgi:hypothetical protein
VTLPAANEHPMAHSKPKTWLCVGSWEDNGCQRQTGPTMVFMQWARSYKLQSVFQLSITRFQALHRHHQFHKSQHGDRMHPTRSKNNYWPLLWQPKSSHTVYKVVIFVLFVFLNFTQFYAILRNLSREASCEYLIFLRGNPRKTPFYAILRNLTQFFASHTTQSKSCVTRIPQHIIRTHTITSTCPIVEPHMSKM